MAELAAVPDGEGVRERGAGAVLEVEEALLVLVARAASRVVVEPVRVGAAAGEDRAGHLGHGGAGAEEEPPPRPVARLRGEDHRPLERTVHHQPAVDGDLEVGPDANHAPGADGEHRAGSYRQLARDVDPGVRAPVGGGGNVSAMVVHAVDASISISLATSTAWMPPA